MSDWPSAATPSQRVIHAFGPQSMGVYLAATATAVANSNAWPTSNRAFFIPFVVTEPILAQQMGVSNGASVSGNIDVGIYDSQGNKLVTKGSTAQSGTSTEQLFDITDTPLDRGLYYMAVAMNNGTGTLLFAFPSGTYSYRSLGMWIMDTAFALPTTATFASVNSNTLYLPSVYVVCESI